MSDCSWVAEGEGALLKNVLKTVGALIGTGALKGANTVLHILCEKSFFNEYLFSKAERKTNLNQVNLCLCQCSLRLNDVFKFLTLLSV